MTAERFVLVLFSEQYQLLAFCQTVRVVGRTAAFNADGVYLLNVFGYCHKCWHRTEWLAEEICVKTCDDDSDAPVGQSLHYFNDGVIEELSLVNTYDFHLI